MLTEHQCHRLGTAVPIAWHDCAYGVAQLCQADGTRDVSSQAYIFLIECKNIYIPKEKQILIFLIQREIIQQIIGCWYLSMN